MRKSAVVCGLVFAAIAMVASMPGFAEETTTVELKKGEVVDVAVNHLWARDLATNQIKHFVVPNDYRFLVDGKEVSIHELRKGTRFDAMIVKHYAGQGHVEISEADIPAQVAAVKQTAPAPAPAAAPVAAAPVAQALPKTAGPLPLIGLAGLGLLGTGAGLGIARRRQRQA